MKTTATILVVDDEASIRRLLRGALDRAGYRVVECADARAALAALPIDKPDVVLLDLGLPDREGLELLPLIVGRADTAVLVISARDGTEEKVAALDLGADDFVTKPFDTEELLARVRAALRRRASRGEGGSRVAFGPNLIDLENRSVVRAGAEVRLTPKEFALLAALAAHPGRVLTHANLLRSVWGEAHVDDVEYLRVAIRALRHKLEPNPAAPVYLTNEPGVGYRLKADAAGRVPSP